VKAQVVLAETGETLHLTFAPGERKKKVIAHIDGATVTGEIFLEGLDHAKAPSDATVRLVFPSHAAPAVMAPPPPAPVVKQVTAPPAPPVVKVVETTPVVVKEPEPTDTAAPVDSKTTTTSKRK